MNPTGNVSSKTVVLYYRTVQSRIFNAAFILISMPAPKLVLKELSLHHDTEFIWVSVPVSLLTFPCFSCLYLQWDVDIKITGSTFFYWLLSCTFIIDFFFNKQQHLVMWHLVVAFSPNHLPYSSILILPQCPSSHEQVQLIPGLELGTHKFAPHPRVLVYIWSSHSSCLYKEHTIWGCYPLFSLQCSWNK